MKEKDIRILLVDNHDLVFQGLKRMVECSLPETRTVCIVSSGREVLLLIASQCLNPFLLDMELPGLSGLRIISRTREEDPQARIIVNTMHEEIWFVRDLVQCDVNSTLFKSVDSNKIVKAIRRVLDGGTYYCTHAEQAYNQMRCSDRGQREELTQHELDVLKYISKGKDTQKTVQDLCISANTVNAHRCRLLDKLDIRNVADLIMTAISRGIILIRRC